MKKPAIRFTLFISLLSIGLFGQGKSQIKAFADENFARGNFELALTEYNRLVFFSKDNEEISHYNFKIAQCYMAIGELDKANYHFDRAFYASDNDSLKYEATLSNAKCHILQRNLDLAIFELMNLDVAQIDTAKLQAVAFYLGVSHYLKTDFEEAKAYFLQTLHPSDTATVQQVEELLSSRKNLYRPNPKLAYRLSLFPPGTGQFYAGDIKNGLNSLLLNAALLALAANIAATYSFLDALISIVPWVQRYYLGGMEKAERIATEKRTERRRETYRKLLNLLEGAKNAI